MPDFSFEEQQPVHIPLAGGSTTIDASVPAGARFSLVTPPGAQLVAPAAGVDSVGSAGVFNLSNEGSSAARVRFSVLTVSKHFGGNVPDDINEQNPGIAVERVHALGGNWYASYGALLYKNSFRNTGVFLSGTISHRFAINDDFHLEVGIAGGPVYGYTPEQVHAPFAGPFTAMGGARIKLGTPVRMFGRNLGVELFVVPPPSGDAYGVTALQFVFE